MRPPATRYHPTPRRPPRESEPQIFRDTGTPDPPEAQPSDFLALLVESVTLTLQAAAEQVSRELPWGFEDRHRVDERIALLLLLIEDRRVILEAHEGRSTVPRDVLERHAWLAIEEARLNVRDAPDSWEPGRATATARAAERGAAWLNAIGIDAPSLQR